MNSRKPGGKAVPDANAGDCGPSVKGKKYQESDSDRGSRNLDQLNHDLADMSIGTTTESGWEVVGKKNRLQVGVKNSWSAAPNAWGNSGGGARKGWGSITGTGRTTGNNWGQAKAPVPPLQHDRRWPARGGSFGSQPRNQEGNTSYFRPEEEPAGAYGSETNTVTHQSSDGSDDDDDDDDDDEFEDSDEDLSDYYDSDDSQKSHETRKKNKWLKPLFGALDSLTIEQIQEQTRQWHCPACHDGPGAIDWYKGLQPLITHAKTKGTTRVKLHRELASLLEEELQRRGTSVVPAGEAFGKWKAVSGAATDHEIVWPPMVIIRNTLLEKDDNDKWLGMGNQELVEYYKLYRPQRARHSYGPNGHRGMIVLIFESSAVGYLLAEQLHKDFIADGRDRNAWEWQSTLFLPGGFRQMYGYLACKKDMDIFNQHSAGKSCLKFDMKSHKEMVLDPMKQMEEDNQQLIWLKSKLDKHKQRSKALEESFGVVSQKLRETMEENRIVRMRTTIQHQENKEEMDYLECFFKEQMEKICKAFEKFLQEEHVWAKQTDIDFGSNEDCKRRKEEMARFIDSQLKDVEEIAAERDKLLREHEEKKVLLKHKHLQEEVQLEEDFDTALTKLMQKHTPSTFASSIP